jgi:hypothetical protein
MKGYRETRSYEESIDVDVGGIFDRREWNLKKGYLFNEHEEYGAPCPHAIDLGPDEDYNERVPTEPMNMWHIPWVIFDSGWNTNGICMQCVLDKAKELGIEKED